MDHIKEGFNAYNDPIYLFHDEAGTLHDGKESWWIENHATDYFSDSVHTKEEADALFASAVGNANWNEYR